MAPIIPTGPADAAKTAVAFSEFAKNVGVPAVILLIVISIFGYYGKVWLIHGIEMENRSLEHRIATETAQQQILGHTLSEFLRAHQEQSEAVGDIRDQLKRQDR